MPKQTMAPVPAKLKRAVEEKANALIEGELKSRYVSPPPENPQFNYIEELYTKWYRGYFYFCAQYRSAGPSAQGGTFEEKFARLTYSGDELFDLAFMRHTGKWVELYIQKTLDECMESISDDAWFHP